MAEPFRLEQIQPDDGREWNPKRAGTCPRCARKYEQVGPRRRVLPTPGDEHIGEMCFECRQQRVVVVLACDGCRRSFSSLDYRDPHFARRRHASTCVTPLKRGG